MTIQLRDVIADLLPIFFLHQKDPTSNSMAGFPARDEDAFYKHWTEKVLGNSASIKKTIVSHDRVVGNILCWKHSDEWYIGYLIGREYWGQGIASKALLEFLQSYTDRPLYAGVARHNKA